MHNNSAPTPEGKVIALSGLERVRAETFNRVYSNNANATLGFYDITVLFGEVIFDHTGSGAVIEDRVAVTMTWEHAKALQNMLERVIHDYETNNSPIRMNRANPEEEHPPA